MAKIIDTTLREGEQAPGVCFSLNTKEKIINDITKLGVDEIELGIASTKNHDLVALCSYIRDNHPQQAFSLWCRCRDEDIRFAAKLNPTCLALSIPASNLHLAKKLGKTKKWATTELRHSIKLALALGIQKVAVGLEDATRADINFVKILAMIAADAGAFRLRIADTVGISTPANITKLLKSLATIKIDLGVHCHNDFGMATANTITALENGATWADVTILGLGERAGNSRLEEVLSYLVVQKGAPYHLADIRTLSRFVATEAGRQICPSQPIIGSNLFSCETGIHLQGLMADPATYEPFDPLMIGAKRKLMIGRKAGKRSIATTLKRLGLPHSDESALNLITRRIRNLAKEYQRPLADHEIIRLAKIT